MSAYPNLERALAAWVRKTLRMLRTTAEAAVIRTGGPTWIKDPTGGFSRVPSALIWNPQFTLAAANGPEWQVILEEVERHAVIRRHFDTLVGTIQGARRWTLPEIAAQMIPRPSLEPGTQAVTIEGWSHFKKRYAAFERIVSRNTIEATVVIPLQDVQFPNRQIELEPGVTLRQLSDEEYLSCLNHQLFDLVPIQGHVTPGIARCSCLAVTLSWPKVIGEARAGDQRTAKLYAANGEIIESFQALLGVAGKRVTISTSLEESFFATVIRVVGNPARPFMNLPPSIVFSTKEMRELRRAWSTIRRHGNQNLALHIAASRLFYAESRRRTEDRILDVMIAAEALYLGNDDSATRGELSYRLALRGAVWANPQDLGVTRSEVFSILREAYSVRSTVAHGAIPNKIKLKVSGDQKDLAYLIERTTEIVRQGLRKALKEVASKGGTFKPGWENLVLK